MQAGDATGARDAANTLQFELFSGAGALHAAQANAVDAPIQMLIDLQALIRAAWLGDIESADRAALSLARRHAERAAQRADAEPSRKPPLSRGRAGAREFVARAGRERGLRNTDGP